MSESAWPIRAAVRGKEVMQLYYSAPQGLLQKPRRVLAAFGKTQLLEPGACEAFTLSFPVTEMASFDDLEKIAACAFVLEKGRYALYLGVSVQDAEELSYGYEQLVSKVVCQMSDSLAPCQLPRRLLADGPAGLLILSMDSGLLKAGSC